MHIYELYYGRDRKTWESNMQPTRIQTSIGVIMDMFNQKLTRQEKGFSLIDSQDVIPLTLFFMAKAPFNPDGSRVFNKKVWNVFVHATVNKRQDEQNEIIWNGIRFFKMGFELGLWAAPGKINFVPDLKEVNEENLPWRPAEENQQNLEETDEIAFIPLYGDATPIFFDQRMDLEKLWTIPASQLPLYINLLRESTSQSSWAELTLTTETIELLKPLVQRKLVEVYEVMTLPDGRKKVKYDCMLTGPNSSPLVPIPSYELELVPLKPISNTSDATETPPSVIVF